MNYSKAHQNLAQSADTPDVYNNPKKYLGPNYEAVLNFWWYLESLTTEQLSELESKYDLECMRYNREYLTLTDCADAIVGFSTRLRATEASRSHVRGIIGKFPNIPSPVTLELIAMHTILDRGESLIFVPMFSNL
jgi:hypothetical protein